MATKLCATVQPGDCFYLWDVRVGKIVDKTHHGCALFWTSGLDCVSVRQSKIKIGRGAAFGLRHLAVCLQE